jgi:hypothetical protein
MSLLDMRTHRMSRPDAEDMDQSRWVVQNTSFTSGSVCWIDVLKGRGAGVKLREPMQGLQCR